MIIAFFLKTSLILAAAWGATTAMRRSSAASRHVIWIAAFIAVLTLPIAARLSPAVPIAAPSAAIGLRSEASTTSLLFTSRNDEQRATGVGSGPQQSGAVTLEWLALGIMALGSAVLSLRWLRGLAYRRRIEMHSMRCRDERILLTAARASEALGITRPFQLRLSPSDIMPCTWGVATPRVLLPLGATRWNDERLELVLLHELAHVQRRDALTSGIARAAFTLLWWNPIAWIARTCVQFERERACDDAVLRSGASPSAYADELLTLSESLVADRSVSAALAMARHNGMAARLRAILDPKHSRARTTHIAAAVAATLLLAQLPLAAVYLTSPVVELPAFPLELAFVAVPPPPPPPPPPPARRRAEGSPQDAAQTRPEPIPAGEFGAGAYKPGNGVTNPERIHNAKPKYTQEALAAGVRGSVELQGVINVDGTVGELRVTRSLDTQYGLDERAMQAVREMRFMPSKLNGNPVPAIVIFEMSFTPDDSPAGNASPQVRQIPTGAFGAGSYEPNGAAGVVAPKRQNEVRPFYTAEARAARIEGIVELECVVNADGTVGDVRVTKSLDPRGLDQQAISAAKATRFVRGTINGAPAAFRVTMELQFTLR